MPCPCLRHRRTRIRAASAQQSCTRKPLRIGAQHTVVLPISIVERRANFVFGLRKSSGRDFRGRCCSARRPIVRPIPRSGCTRSSGLRTANTARRAGKPAPNLDRSCTAKTNPWLPFPDRRGGEPRPLIGVRRTAFDGRRTGPDGRGGWGHWAAARRSGGWRQVGAISGGRLALSMASLWHD